MGRKQAKKIDGRANNGGHNKWTPTERDLTMIEDLSGRGVPIESIAYCVGVAPSCFYRAEKEFPEIARRLELGKAKAADALTRSAFESATVDKNPAMISFLLKTRLGWREKDPDVNQTLVLNITGENYAQIREAAASFRAKAITASSEESDE